jgi:hypothetical protein
MASNCAADRSSSGTTPGFLIAFESLRLARLRAIWAMAGSWENRSSHKVPDPVRATPPAQPELASIRRTKGTRRTKSTRRTKGVGEKPEIESQ